MEKRLISLCLWVILILGVVLWDHAVRAASLVEIIEGAKKEGTVSVKFLSGVTPKSMERLRREVREKFGADLKILPTPTGDFQKDLTQAIMEYKAGATPSYDLMTLGPEHVVPGFKAGIFEKVAWSSLLPKEASPCVIVNLPPYGEVGMSYYSSYGGLMYNPEKIPAGETPKTLGDLAAPKFKGKVGIYDYPDVWAARAFIMGKDRVLPQLRAILKNGAIKGKFVDLLNRYLLGEISVAVISTPFFKMAQEKGKPVEWQNIEYIDEKVRPLVLRKGAQHPNAATLLAIHLTGPQGAKFMLEESGSGNACYPGNWAYDIKIKGKEQGIPIISSDKLIKAIEFYESEEYVKWTKEIKLIFDTGGER